MAINSSHYKLLKTKTRILIHETLAKTDLELQASYSNMNIHIQTLTNKEKINHTKFPPLFSLKICMTQNRITFHNLFVTCSHLFIPPPTTPPDT